MDVGIDSWIIVRGRRIFHRHLATRSFSMYFIASRSPRSVTKLEHAGIKTINKHERCRTSLANCVSRYFHPGDTGVRTAPINFPPIRQRGNQHPRFLTWLITPRSIDYQLDHVDFTRFTSPSTGTRIRNA